MFSCTCTCTWVNKWLRGVVSFVSCLDVIFQFWFIFIFLFAFFTGNAFLNSFFMFSYVCVNFRLFITLFTGVFFLIRILVTFHIIVVTVCMFTLITLVEPILFSSFSRHTDHVFITNTSILIFINVYCLLFIRLLGEYIKL